MNQKISTIDSVWAQREAEKAIRLMERLMSHKTFIEQARRSKTERGASLALEHEVILHARDAEHDAREFSVITLRLAAHFKNVGVFDEVISYWTQKLSTEGPIKVEDLWAKAVDDLQLPKQLQSAGLSDSTIQWLGSQIDSVNLILEVNNSGELTARFDSEKRKVTITAPPKLGQAKSIGDLLLARQLDTTIAALLEPGKVIAPMLLTRTAKDRKLRVNFVDGLLAAVISNLHETTRQRRQFEDVGLPVVQGNVVGELLQLLGLALFAAGLVVHAVCASKGEPLDCPAAWVLYGLSAVVFGVGVFLAQGEIVIVVGFTGGGLTASEPWPVRAGDIPAYQGVVQGGF